MKKPVWILAGVFLYLLSFPALAQSEGESDGRMRGLTIESTYDGAQKLHVTRGTLQSGIALDPFARIVSRTEEYGDWALVDINKDFGDKEYLTLLRALKRLPDGKLEGRYDLNLPWPFNFKNLALLLREVGRDLNENTGTLRRLQFTIDEPTFSLKRFTLDFRVREEAGQGILDFEFAVEIASPFSSFFSHEKYVRNIQSRIAQVLLNMRQRALREK